MTVFRSLEEIPAALGCCVLTIGNFDGVHTGHQHIMRRVCSLAKDMGCSAAVLTFDPHPAKILAPERARPRIMTTAMRLERMRDVGIDTAFVLPFSAEFSRLTPEEFVTAVLRDGVHARRVLVGRDFRFGSNQSGDIETLRELGSKHGFEVEPVDAITCRGERVSSTAIRNHVAAGEVSRACRLLGRPFALQGHVVRGQGIGSKQTVPTLNLATDNELLPREGVYVTRTHEVGSSRQWHSITNVGTRPTFEGEGLTIETFLLAPFDGDTPSAIVVEFLRWVRPERKFESPEALKSQIFRDVAVANRLHRRLGRVRMK